MLEKIALQYGFDFNSVDDEQLLALIEADEAQVDYIDENGETKTLKVVFKKAEVQDGQNEDEEVEKDEP